MKERHEAGRATHGSISCGVEGWIKMRLSGKKRNCLSGMKERMEEEQEGDTHPFKHNVLEFLYILKTTRIIPQM